jgi:16S rRNA (cytosine967-C5)-methyltransferase
LSKIVDDCFIADSFDAKLRRLADDGEIYFQDEASQLVTQAAKPASGESFFDVCASPGGKTTAIVSQAMSAQKAGKALFLAGDVTDRRVKLLRATCLKQGLDNVSIVQYDAAFSLPLADRTFDVVFVDAPCTGTGTIRHNPEIRYIVEPSDLERMQAIQLAIFANAAKLVKAGGRLIYSTCSLELEENEAVIDAFLASRSGWRTVPPSIPERLRTADGYARTFPHRDRADGFFIADLSFSI